MKQLVMLGLTVVGVASGALSRASPGDSRTLLENEQAWAKAAVDGDADRMAKYMADEYLELAGSLPPRASRHIGPQRQSPRGSSPFGAGRRCTPRSSYIT